MRRRFTITIEKGPTGLSAHVPELPSILVTGRTVEELRARANLEVEVRLHVSPPEG